MSSKKQRKILEEIESLKKIMEDFIIGAEALADEVKSLRKRVKLLEDEK